MCLVYHMHIAHFYRKQSIRVKNNQSISAVNEAITPQQTNFFAQCLYGENVLLFTPHSISKSHINVYMEMRKQFMLRTLVMHSFTIAAIVERKNGNSTWFSWNFDKNSFIVNSVYRNTPALAHFELKWNRTNILITHSFSAGVKWQILDVVSYVPMEIPCAYILPHFIESDIFNNIFYAVLPYELWLIGNEINQTIEKIHNNGNLPEGGGGGRENVKKVFVQYPWKKKKNSSAKHLKPAQLWKLTQNRHSKWQCIFIYYSNFLCKKMWMVVCCVMYT